MSEEEDKKPEEENPSGEDKAGADNSTAATLIKNSERLSEDNGRLKQELEELKMKVAAINIAGVTEAGQQEVSEEKKKVNDAAEFFKGSQLEKDIRKANE